LLDAFNLVHLRTLKSLKSTKDEQCVFGLKMSIVFDIISHLEAYLLTQEKGHGDAN
jgi:hypothetical protein